MAAIDALRTDVNHENVIALLNEIKRDFDTAGGSTAAFDMLRENIRVKIVQLTEIMEGGPSDPLTRNPGESDMDFTKRQAAARRDGLNAADLPRLNNESDADYNTRNQANKDRLARIAPAGREFGQYSPTADSPRGSWNDQEAARVAAASGVNQFPGADAAARSAEERAAQDAARRAVYHAPNPDPTPKPLGTG